VLVLVENKERQATAEENIHVRAADILAQRLPSVPDKPATDANSATGATEGSAKPPVAKTAAKPAGTAPTTAPAAKKPAGTSTVPSASAPGAGQSAKAVDRTSSVQKNGGAAGGAVTGPKPEASETTPASEQPKAAEPTGPASPTAPPANPKPPADESSPQ
jgi:hypothetical protein